MNILHLTESVEKALTEVCHFALQGKGLEILNHVNQVASAIQQTKQGVNDAKTASEVLDAAKPAAEQIDKILEIK